jgi:hypothetical protein
LGFGWISLIWLCLSACLFPGTLCTDCCSVQNAFPWWPCHSASALGWLQSFKELKFKQKTDEGMPLKLTG